MDVILAQFVSIVAKAFYSDIVVVILELLVQERFIREEEIACRLCIPAKEANKVLIQLEKELLIKKESMDFQDEFLGEESRNVSVCCYYVDYQTFAHVVRYRFYLIQEELKSKGKSAHSGTYLECPVTHCKRRYTLEEAMQNCMDRTLSFVCLDCCGEPTTSAIRATTCDPKYHLKEGDNRRQRSGMDTLADKFDIQCKQILELLKELKGKPLPRNLPSDNLQRFQGPSQPSDEDVIEEIMKARRGLKLLSRKHISSTDISDITIEMDSHISKSSSSFTGGPDRLRKGSNTGRVPGAAVETDQTAPIEDQLREPILKKPRNVEYPAFLRADTDTLSIPTSAPPSSGSWVTSIETEASHSIVETDAANGVAAAHGGDDVEWED